MAESSPLLYLLPLPSLESLDTRGTAPKVDALGLRAAVAVRVGAVTGVWEASLSAQSHSGGISLPSSGASLILGRLGRGLEALCCALRAAVGHAGFLEQEGSGRSAGKSCEGRGLVLWGCHEDSWWRVPGHCSAPASTLAGASCQRGGTQTWARRSLTARRRRVSWMPAVCGAAPSHQHHGVHLECP